VDCLADAVVHLLTIVDPPDWVNVGTGTDLTIIELAKLIAETTGYTGKILTDPSRPDGTPVKCTDVSLLRSLGWHHRVELREGLQRAYRSFLEESHSGQLRSI
jgi:GDP-L-fucose synthase